MSSVLSIRNTFMTILLVALCAMGVHYQGYRNGTVKNYNTLTQKISEKRDAISAVESEIARLQLEIAVKNERILELQKELKEIAFAKEAVEASNRAKMTSMLDDSCILFSPKQYNGGCENGQCVLTANPFSKFHKSPVEPSPQDEN